MTASSSNLSWKRHKIVALGLALDLFDASPILDGGTEVSEWLLQTAEPIQIGLWYGPDQTLDKWRAGFGAWQGVTFKQEQVIQVCGRPARKQQAHVPEQPSAEGVFVNRAGKRQYRTKAFAPLTAVVIAFEQRGTPVLVGWQIETAHREAYRAAEEHFFASLSCF